MDAMNSPTTLEGALEKIKQLEEKNAILAHQYTDLKNHFDNLYKVKLSQCIRRAKLQPAKQHTGFVIESIRWLRNSTLVDARTRYDICELLLRSPWPCEMAYDTVWLLLEQQLAILMPTLGYTRVLTGNWKPQNLLEHFETAEPTAFYPRLVYRESRNYQLSILATRWPTHSLIKINESENKVAE